MGGVVAARRLASSFAPAVNGDGAVKGARGFRGVREWWGGSWGDERMRQGRERWAMRMCRVSSMAGSLLGDWFLFDLPDQIQGKG